jgi:hypothetical protein
MIPCIAENPKKKPSSKSEYADLLTVWHAAFFARVALLLV